MNFSSARRSLIKWGKSGNNPKIIAEIDIASSSDEEVDVVGTPESPPMLTLIPSLDCEDLTDELKVHVQHIKPETTEVLCNQIDFPTTASEDGDNSLPMLTPVDILNETDTGHCPKNKDASGEDSATEQSDTASTGTNLNDPDYHPDTENFKQQMLRPRRHIQMTKQQRKDIFEEYYATKQYPTKEEYRELAKRTGTTEIRVKNWFCTRRFYAKKSLPLDVGIESIANKIVRNRRQSTDSIRSWSSRSRGRGRTLVSISKPREQIEELEASYQKNPFLTNAENLRISTKTGLKPSQISQWFKRRRRTQNRLRRPSCPPPPAIPNTSTASTLRTQSAISCTSFATEDAVARRSLRSKVIEEKEETILIKQVNLLLPPKEKILQDFFNHQSSLPIPREILDLSKVTDLCPSDINDWFERKRNELAEKNKTDDIGSASDQSPKKPVPVKRNKVETSDGVEGCADRAGISVELETRVLDKMILLGELSPTTVKYLWLQLENCCIRLMEMYTEEATTRSTLEEESKCLKSFLNHYNPNPNLINLYVLLGIENKDFVKSHREEVWDADYQDDETDSNRSQYMNDTTFILDVLTPWTIVLLFAKLSRQTVFQSLMTLAVNDAQLLLERCWTVPTILDKCFAPGKST